MQQLKRDNLVYIIDSTGSYISLFLTSCLDKRKCIYFYEKEEEAYRIKEEMEFFSGQEVFMFPAYTERFFQKEEEAKRVSFLSKCLTEEGFIGLFPYTAIGHPLPHPATFIEKKKTITLKTTIYPEELLDYLNNNGYEQTALVREEGEYAKRGGILDVFPPSYKDPIRLEFLGDEVFSIRSFDKLTQRSKKEVKAVELVSARPLDLQDAFITDYLQKGMAFVHKGFDYIKGYIEQRGGDGGLIEGFMASLIKGLNIDISGITDGQSTVINIRSNEDLKHLFESKRQEIYLTLAKKIKEEWKEMDFVYCFTSNAFQAERIQEVLRGYGISLPICKDPPFKKEKEWGIIIGPLRKGFRTDKAIVITEEDLFGPKKRLQKRGDKARIEGFIDAFKTLQIGEYVVHIEYGIGIYRGITRLEVEGFERDFVLIEYEDKDRLYVPVEDLHLVQKFIGGDRYKPKLDRLGSSYWKITKKRVKSKIEEIAKELLAVYAERSISEGYAYPPEDELFREMESRFEYEETEDQAKAIEAVLTDLKSKRPMDRLICGDAGFGKTEVALRASFKVAIEGRQVALLVPTTVLAQQHYKTFVERFKDYPVRVEVLSRFRSKIEQKGVVEEIKKGKVDIIIGTHRLLQRDISFKDLGLLIVDEEHRFGVKHKERLKQIKKDIDVLALSATPIPRTLYMATTGIRDLSIINTPPLDRVAVKTMVVRFKEEVIKEGIIREIERGGQVFFVHNYIHNIEVIFNYLKGLCPDWRIALAHGRMRPNQLERIMVDFIEKRYDTLLSTNIIESGLDISNVNTIYINNAHKLGLAELYQLRGRVGRGERQGYAYLLVPDRAEVSREAELRLKIMEELIEPGSGFIVANHDLEIRGAGNLLGREQSGNISLIGFELYCDMLEEAINTLRDKKQEEEKAVLPEIKLKVDAYLPDTYVEDQAQKLLIYKRLSKVRDKEELEEIKEETYDRYGVHPQPFVNLLDMVSLRLMLMDSKISRLESNGKTLSFYITEATPLNMERLLRLIKEGKDHIKLMPDKRVIVFTDEKGPVLIHDAKKLLMDIFLV